MGESWEHDPLDVLEKNFWSDARLFQNPSESACSKFRMQWHHAADRASVTFTSEHYMTPALSNASKPKPFKSANRISP